MDENSIELLARQEFLEGVDPEVLKGLVANAKEKIYQPGQVILQEGTRGREVVMILEGEVEVVKDMDGEPVSLAHQGPGNLFGEMGFLEDRPRFATVRALKLTRVLEFTENDLRSTLSADPELLFRTTQILSGRLRLGQQVLIDDLQRKNQELEKAYRELQAAQAEIVVKERMERELELAREMQTSFLPKTFPKLPGVDIAARTQPARQVGGDFYDVFALDKQHLGIVMADVSDKGMPAALYMALTRSLMRSEARRNRSPRQVLLNINRLLMEVTEASMFVTVLYGVIDLPKKILRYSRAGHEYPLLYSQEDCDFQMLQSTGTLLGMLENINLEEQEVPLRSGDLLILYTDGVTDAKSKDDEFYGAQRLQDAICEAKAGSASELCDALFEQVVAFQSGAVQFDDITLMVVGFDISVKKP
jgi:sigma-B regulation protein RsbU (phosphoserine phosphatase)